MSNTVPTKPFSLDEALGENYAKKKVATVLVEKPEQESLVERLKKTKRVEPSDYQSEDLSAKKRSNKDLNILLTAMKVWSPMIAAIGSSNKEGTIEDATVDLHHLISSCNDVVGHLSAEFADAGLSLASENNRWVLRQLLSNVSITLSKQFMTNGNLDNETIKELYSNLIGIITGSISTRIPNDNVEFVSDLTDKSREKYSDLTNLLTLGDSQPISDDDESAIACSLLKAMEPVVNELQRFAWFIEPQAVAQKCAEQVILGAGYLYESCLAGGLKPTGRGSTMFMQSCLDKSSTSFVNAYRKHAYETINYIKSIIEAPERRQEIKKVKTIGIPFDEINITFEKSLGLQVSLTRSGAEFLKSNLIGGTNVGKKSESGGGGTRQP
jgi:hypothetical protein